MAQTIAVEMHFPIQPNKDVKNTTGQDWNKSKEYLEEVKTFEAYSTEKPSIDKKRDIEEGRDL